MFGLAHCSFFCCLMNESSSIPEAERQPLFLCPVCLRKMCKALKFDILARYAVMLEQLGRLSSELRDTCSCGTKEVGGSEGEVCDTGDEDCVSSKGCNYVVGLEQNHSAAEEAREELTATCEQRVTKTVVPADGTMQEEGSSCSAGDCQLEHLRKATEWLKVQLGVACET